MAEVAKSRRVFRVRLRKIVSTGLLIAATSFTLPSAPAVQHASSPKIPTWPDALKTQILATYEKSMQECDISYRGQEDCVKTQFALNYRYYVLKDQQSYTGPPGVPGPISGSESWATPSDRAQGSR